MGMGIKAVSYTHLDVYKRQIEGGAYVGGQLKAVVDGFGSVEQGGPFSVIWNDTGAATNEPYTCLLYTSRCV